MKSPKRNVKYKQNFSWNFAKRLSCWWVFSIFTCTTSFYLLFKFLMCRTPSTFCWNVSLSYFRTRGKKLTPSLSLGHFLSKLKKISWISLMTPMASSMRGVMDFMIMYSHFAQMIRKTLGTHSWTICSVQNIRRRITGLVFSKFMLKEQIFYESCFIHNYFALLISGQTGTRPLTTLFLPFLSK